LLSIQLNFWAKGLKSANKGNCIIGRERIAIGAKFHKKGPKRAKKGAKRVKGVDKGVKGLSAILKGSSAIVKGLGGNKFAATSVPKQNWGGTLLLIIFNV
jgi:hypothetical protein